MNVNLIIILGIVALIIYIAIGTAVGRYFIDPKHHDTFDYILASVSGFVILTSAIGFGVFIYWLINTL